MVVTVFEEVVELKARIDVGWLRAATTAAIKENQQTILL